MSFKQKFLKDTLVYGIGNILSKGMQFILLPYYTRVLLPDEYALITLTLVCVPFAKTMFSLEISQAVAIFLADYPDRAKTVVSTAFWTTVALNTALLGACYGILTTLNIIDLSTLNQGVLLVIVGALFMDSLYYSTQNVLRWQLRSKAFNVISVSVGVVEGVLIIGLISVAKLSVLGVFLGWLIARCGGFLAGWWTSRSSYGWIFDRATWKEMVTFSTPLLFNNIPNAVNASIDRIFVAKLLGLFSVGVYGVAYTFSGGLSILVTSLSAAVAPIIYRHHRDEGATKNIGDLFNGVLVLLLLVPVLFMLFCKDVLTILIDEKYLEPILTSPVISLVMSVIICRAITDFFPGLLVKRKTWYIFIFSLISLGLNTGLNYLLTKQLGILGTALATVISVGVGSVLYIMASQRFFKVTLQASKLCLIAVLMSTFAVISYGLNSHLPTLTLASLALKSVVALGMVTILAVTLFPKRVKQVAHRVLPLNSA